MTVASDKKDADNYPMQLALALSDFSLIERFAGFYPYGERSEGFFTVKRSDGNTFRPEHRHNEQEPAHTVIVNASWSYERDSEKLIFDGREARSGVLYAELAVDREHGDLSRGSPEGLALYFPQRIFAPLVSAVQRGTIASMRLPSPISPAPVVDTGPDFLPAYLSNGVIGLRVRDIPLRAGVATVSGLEGEHPAARVACVPEAPHPLAADIKLDTSWLSSIWHRVHKFEPRYDFATGELHSVFDFR